MQAVPLIITVSPMTPYEEIFPGNKIDGHDRAKAWDPRTYIRAAPEGNELMTSKSYLVVAVAAVLVASATSAQSMPGWIFYDPYLQPPHYLRSLCRVPWGRPWARRP